MFLSTFVLVCSAVPHLGVNASKEAVLSLNPIAMRLPRSGGSYLEVTGRTISRAAGMDGGSTDMGNVSQVVRSIQLLMTFIGQTTPIHDPAFAETAVAPAVDDALIDGARTIAKTVIEVAKTPELRARFAELKVGRPRRATQVGFRT